MIRDNSAMVEHLSAPETEESVLGKEMEALCRRRLEQGRMATVADCDVILVGMEQKGNQPSRGETLGPPKPPAQVPKSKDDARSNKLTLKKLLKHRLRKGY